MSPYIFIVVMSCLFHDVHKGDKQKLKEQRIHGMDVDEILYADGKICVTQDETAMDKLLSSIEAEGKRYGFKLNRSKCEYLPFCNAGNVKFKDGSLVPRKTEVKHLGCNLNNKGNPGKEIIKRISDCMVTLNKLHIFFYTSDNTVARQIHVFHAVIRAKLL